MNLRSIFVVARTTLLEAVRRKELNLTVLFAVVAIFCSLFLSQVTIDEEIKFLKDFCLGAISFFGVILAILGVAQMIPAEIENRTLYTVLSKPVRRWEFLLGKYFGLLAQLVISSGLMVLVSVGVIYAKEQALLEKARADFGPTVSVEQREMQERDLQDITRQTRDPRLVQALLLVLAKLAVTAGLALFVSTFATSTMFTVSVTSLLYLCGHLLETARQVWFYGDQAPTLVMKWFYGVVSLVIPNFESFNAIDEILLGNPVPWSHTLHILGYSAVYLLVLLALAGLIFEEREL